MSVPVKTSCAILFMVISLLAKSSCMVIASSVEKENALCPFPIFLYFLASSISFPSRIKTGKSFPCIFASGNKV